MYAILGFTIPISKRVQNMDSQLFQHIPLKLRVTKPTEN